MTSSAHQRTYAFLVAVKHNQELPYNSFLVHRMGECRNDRRLLERSGDQTLWHCPPFLFLPNLLDDKRLLEWSGDQALCHWLATFNVDNITDLLAAVLSN